MFTAMATGFLGGCYCQVDSDGTIRLCDTCKYKSIKVFVRTLDGKTISLEVGRGHSSPNICKMKQLIHEKTGTPIDQIRLIFAGKEMQSCDPTPPCTGACRRLENFNVQGDSVLHMVLRLRDHRPNTLQFEASECTITCGQQLALPRLTVCMQREGPPREVHFLVEGARVSFSDTTRVAGTISFKSDDPSIAEVEGSNILTRSAGSTTLTATFSPSCPECKEFPENNMNTTCDLRVIVW